VLTKRLERGTFSWPKNLEEGQSKLWLAPQALAMLTDGVDLRGGKLHASSHFLNWLVVPLELNLTDKRRRLNVFWGSAPAQPINTRAIIVTE
jgi:hypothetical protein